MLLTCANIIFFGWMMRRRARHRTEMRVMHLRQAAPLLRRHGDAMERFLGAQAAPVEMKRLLLNYSAAMADRKFVAQCARDVSEENGPWTITEDGAALLATVEQLRSTEPALVDDFEDAICAGGVGAFLRWPESAKHLDLLMARLASNPRQEIAAAADVARRRYGVAFGGKPDVFAAEVALA